jgi:hypothetical protein
MAKTHVPDAFRIGRNEILATAKPDAYDLRDREYRPMLRTLLPVLDARPAKGEFKVLTQVGNSCTGHAIAAVINTVLARQAVELNLPAPGLVSPYMLYRMARRYDEYHGEDDIGSSLRGAFKGWLRHGVALDSQWKDLTKLEGLKDEIEADPDLDNPAFIAACRQRPLGAYYRVNAYSLDDMQSAINELRAIAVSAAIHQGWRTPVKVIPPGGGKALMVIKRDQHADPAGGHAFALVGYNEIGFLVQNSWGTGWGDRGFATLLYDDWLASAYDAWVCRPGVPATPLAAPSVSSRVTTTGEIVLSGGPNVTLLRKYVVNTGNDGKLSTTGKFVSSIAQVDEIFDNMTQKHDAWVAEGEAKGTPEGRHVVIYAHGGVIGEGNGLGIADHQLGWWLKSHVYPISLCWESGAMDTIGDAVGDLLHRVLPFGAIEFDSEEQADKRVEWTSRTFFRGLWEEMKGNALGHSAEVGQSDVRGGNLLAFKLATYRNAHPDLKIHLVGHSAGTIVLAGLVRRLSSLGLPIESVAFMGGAATNELVAADVLPAFRAGANHATIARFTTFNLSERREQDDTCAALGKVWYHKSLLYLVSRSLEDLHKTPVLGLSSVFDGSRANGEFWHQHMVKDVRAWQKFFWQDTAQIPQAITGGDGLPAASRLHILKEPDVRTSSMAGGKSVKSTHGAFDNSAAIVSATLLRILDTDRLPQPEIDLSSF